MSAVIDEDLLLDDNQDYALENNPKWAKITIGMADQETWRRACPKMRAMKIFRVCNRRLGNSTGMQGRN